MKLKKLTSQEILEKIKVIVISDTGSGFVGYNTVTKCYYCGMNKFDKQLRKALIYHDITFLQDVIRYNEMENMAILSTYVICDMSGVNKDE